MKTLSHIENTRWTVSVYRVYFGKQAAAIHVINWMSYIRGLLVSYNNCNVLDSLKYIIIACMLTLRWPVSLKIFCARLSKLGHTPSTCRLVCVTWQISAWAKSELVKKSYCVWLKRSLWNCAGAQCCQSPCIR